MGLCWHSREALSNKIIPLRQKNSLINGNEENKKETENILNISDDVNEDEMKKNKNTKISIDTKQECSSYNNSYIKYKQNILVCRYHKKAIRCCTILKDGRLVTCSDDKSIIVYNSKTFKIDLEIKEHIGKVNQVIKLKSGILASSSNDATIKLFNIKKNNYEFLQTLFESYYPIYKIYELNNEKLISCPYDVKEIINNIIVYSIINNKYTKEYQLETDGPCLNVIQTKKKEICIRDNKICFYDLFKRKIITKLNNIEAAGNSCFNMITKDLLLITGDNTLYIINVIQHNLVRKIDTPDSDCICTSIRLKKNIILTGDTNHMIKQWKLKGDNLKLISLKKMLIIVEYLPC